MPVDSEELRKTMRTWVSGVSIVTTALGNHRAGVTASSFTSVSLEPALVLVCLQKHIATYRLIEQSGIFAISLLTSDQVNLSKQFAGFVQLPDGEDRFYSVGIMEKETGAPILAEALAWMDCRLTSIYDAGSTGIVIGEVLATGQKAHATPLVYHNRTYFDLVSKPDNS